MTRKGGVSPSPFDSLNLGTNTEDKEENVIKNKELYERSFSFKSGTLKTLTQVHGNKVAVAGDDTDTEADAIITDQHDLPIGVLTADCVPILLCNEDKKAVGAVHAGWRGMVGGIIENTIEALKERYGAKADELTALIGPAIGPCCYEVSEDVAEQFREKLHNVIRVQDDNIFLDLPSGAFSILSKAGVRAEKIWSSGHCTSCETDLFFSYRKENGKTGRQLSFIMIKE